MSVICIFFFSRNLSYVVCFTSNVWLCLIYLILGYPFPRYNLLGKGEVGASISFCAFCMLSAKVA